MLSLGFTREEGFDVKVDARTYDADNEQYVNEGESMSGKVQDPEFVFAITQSQREYAARLRVAADEKNGVETPAWIKRLAQKVDGAKNDADNTSVSSRDSWKSSAKNAGKKIGGATKKTVDVVLDLWASSS